MAESLSTLCTTSTFASSLVLPGADILAITANLVADFNAESPGIFRMNQPSTSLMNATFCNVTVTYTHSGQNDEINVETWLPISSSGGKSNTSPGLEEKGLLSGLGSLSGSWNGRLQAIGGAGLVAGRSIVSYLAMYGALADGYATTTTDAGLRQGMNASDTSNDWALLSPGNVNLYKLQNLASVSLNDQAKIARSLITCFYQTPPKFTYFNGCSQGGRQALMLAQRYPDAYDGIMAGAPGIHWTELLPAFYWPQHIMNTRNEYPYTCELDAINSAATRVCDRLDGVVDGIISNPIECMETFDPMSIVGQVADECGGNTQGNHAVLRRNPGLVTTKSTLISEAAAVVVKEIWQGLTTILANGTEMSLFPGLYPGSDISGSSALSYGVPGLAATTCKSPSATGTNVECHGMPNQDSVDWLKLFTAKDHNLDLSRLSDDEWSSLVHKSGQEFRSIIGTEDTDLSDFRRAGGKIMAFHGLADQMVPVGATRKYYNSVLDLDSTARDDFFRYFEVPGLGHCLGGKSGQPEQLFGQLRAWVEDGVIPEQSPVKITDLDGKLQNRIICAYPLEPVFDSGCGDSARESCWICRNERSI